MSEPAPEVTINIKGPNELKLPITISTSKSVRDLKDAIAGKSDVEAARQRLIYSGRVLKDDEPLTTYKIQSGHTVHMVKGVAAAQPESAPPQRLPAMQAGQNPSDPLTMLNTPMAHGALAGFNPFADMGINPNDPNMLQTMMESPEFLQQMSSMMQRPEFVDQMIAMDPSLRDNPQLREMFQSEQFRTMLSNPEFLRNMMTMTSQMRQMGMDPRTLGAAGGMGALGGLGSAGAGVGGASGTAGMLEALGGGRAAAGGSGTAPHAFPGFGAGAGAGPAGAAPNPAMLQQLLGGMGGAGGAGANPWAALGGFGAGAGAASPFGAGLGGGGGGGAASTVPAGPPPEERYQTQLQQLSDMGFTNARQNVRALLATGGNVEHAVEYIFGGGGL
ncbi:hypothetical protein FRB96_001589 [Tulasnella sp. 330]|nr:hypothetical protein FRB96_001589 [Tulasnella sp. 330]KAG8876039.1 hypothetical protein FRB97_004505 [Tulasnella sp. 331]KAG8880949.1 hypothetical protein FRB98_004665 [Tulasnella sp. 332]